MLPVWQSNAGRPFKALDQVLRSLIQNLQKLNQKVK
jgi:hypothetical protein